MIIRYELHFKETHAFFSSSFVFLNSLQLTLFVYGDVGSPPLPFSKTIKRKKTQTVIGLKNYDKSRNQLTAYNFWG